ncbi:hypothetical protein ACFL6C_05085 [Myxococcota bacterium]
MALAGAKRAVEIGRLAAAGFHGAVDDRESVLVGLNDGGGDGVIGDRLLGLLDARSQALNEIALADCLGQLN